MSDWPWDDAPANEHLVEPYPGYRDEDQEGYEPPAEPEEPWPEGGVVLYQPKWSQHATPLTRLVAQESGLVVRANDRGVFVRFGTDETPKLCDPDDLTLMIRPGTFTWTPDDDEEAHDGDATTG